MTNTKANNVTTNAAIPRRGFFGALAATVAGAVGLERLTKPFAAPPSSASNEKPVIAAHPNSVPRTEEGSRRHG
jgi:hypothetical protein